MNIERTFVALKPDAVQRGLIGRIVNRFEEKGFKIIAMKMLEVTPEQAAAHYAEHVGKPFYDGLIQFITSAPIVAMVVEGIDAIEEIRHIVGATNPDKADVGSIRADYAQLKAYNTVHGSDSIESAEREINIYFKPEELCPNYKNMMELITESVDED